MNTNLNQLLNHAEWKELISILQISENLEANGILNKIGQVVTTYNSGQTGELLFDDWLETKKALSNLTKLKAIDEEPDHELINKVLRLIEKVSIIIRNGRIYEMSKDLRYTLKTKESSVEKPNSHTLGYIKLINSKIDNFISSVDNLDNNPILFEVQVENYHTEYIKILDEIRTI